MNLSRSLLPASSLLCYTFYLQRAAVSSAWIHVCPWNRNSSTVKSRTMATAPATSSLSEESEASAPPTSPSSPLLAHLRVANSWIHQLSPETAENLQASLKRERIDPKDNARLNQVKRPVHNGHFVPVDPTPLPSPRLVLYSHDVAHNLLRWTPEQVASDEFVQWLSGGTIHDSHLVPVGWATPYALSIMGTRYYNNCPYGTGDGYGDGRAISIAELTPRDASAHDAPSYELQLKGAGPTPFCRGADGRAVLRSSVREFLASEAMHHLNIPTTRALSLIVSDSLRIARPWYTENVQLQLPSEDDPRLQQYTPEQRQQVMAQLRHQKIDPNIMQQEPAAITCRVCSSFVRVGHLDLFARRAIRQSRETQEDSDTASMWNTDTREWKELEQMVWHACYREYRAEAYDPFIGSKDVAGAAQTMLTLAAQRIARMVAHWIRVGFAQGNFNADNCLVGGYTMDYGPFGFMEEYYPLFAKWTGSGPHFGFMNQPNAGFANYQVLVESVAPVICAARGTDDIEAVVKEFMEPAAQEFQAAADAVFRTKLGFEAEHDVGDDVWDQLEGLMRKTRTDWTLLFRQLTYLMKEYPDLKSSDYEGMLTFLEGDDAAREGSSPFYEPLTDAVRSDWMTWVEQWRTALASLDVSTDAVYERMRTTNPKYVLREWMLVDAYNSAAKREEAELFSLYNLIQRPYDEGSTLEEAKYYRRAPEEALKTGGTAFMSCSS